MNETGKGRHSLPSVIGDELSAVCFVRDYVELHFDGPVLRLLGDVSVRSGSEVRAHGDHDFRDWICRYIGQRVVAVGPLSGNEIEITFHGDGVVRVEGRSIGIRFAEFLDYPDRRTQIWEAD